jgi:hypothetical protein
MAIAACFAFQREISSSVLWDFFYSIDPTRTLTVAAPVVTRTPFKDKLLAILFEPTNPRGGYGAAIKQGRQDEQGERQHKPSNGRQDRQDQAPHRASGQPS